MRAAQSDDSEAERNAMIGVVLSRMQPSTLVEAAKAAARARCANQPDQQKRESCLKDAHAQ
jgi:hypothetical protein